MAGARGTDDPVKRAALYGTAQRLMHEQVPSLIPTFFDVLAEYSIDDLVKARPQINFLLGIDTEMPKIAALPAA